MRLRVNPKRTAKALNTNPKNKRGRGRPVLNRASESVKSLFGNKGRVLKGGKAKGPERVTTESSKKPDGSLEKKGEVKKEKGDVKKEKEPEEKEVEIKKETPSTSKETRGTKESKEAKEAKETNVKGGKDPKVTKEPRVVKETRSTKEAKEPKESKDAKESKDSKASKEPEDPKESKATTEAKDLESAEPKDKESKEESKLGESKESKDEPKAKEGKVESKIESKAEPEAKKVTEEPKATTPKEESKTKEAKVISEVTTGSKPTPTPAAPEKKEKAVSRVAAKSPGVTLRGSTIKGALPQKSEKVTDSETAVAKKGEGTGKEKEEKEASVAEPKTKKVEADKEPARSEPTSGGEDKQLVIKLDKLASQELPPPKRSERAAVVQKRKLSEDAPVRPSPGKRGRPPAKAKVPEEPPSEPKVEKEKVEKEKVEKEKVEKPPPEKDERSFERFYAKVKEASVVSERWSFGGVLWDPTKKMKVMAASEVDVTSNGNMRLRRCVQVFENMTVRVMVEGADMTNTFNTTGTVKSANEVSQLIHKVATSKICSGIKNFGATDKVYFPHCVLRGESYYAPECPIVIDYGVVGPLCQHCNRLRNMIHRRNVKETNLLYSKFSRAPVKNIRSGFGKQLYSMLTDMIEASSVDAKKERKKLRRMIPANAKEYPFRSDAKPGEGLDENQQHMLQQQQLQMQLQQQLQMQQQQQHQLQQYIKSDAQGNITISSLPSNTMVTPSTVSSEFIRLTKPFMGQSMNSEMMTFNVVSGQRGSYKMSREGGQLTSSGNYTGTVLTPGEMHMVEQLVLQEGGDVGNVIIQNSGDFTLAEGQEYELIGEADPNNPIQVLEVLKEENEANNTIEIIEVDDQTLAQLTSQNLSNFIIQEPNSDFEVQEIDADDPNFRHLVKALNPGTVVYQS